MIRCAEGCVDSTSILTLTEECAPHRLPMVEINSVEGGLMILLGRT